MNFTAPEALPMLDGRMKLRLKWISPPLGRAAFKILAVIVGEAAG